MVLLYEEFLGDIVIMIIRCTVQYYQQDQTKKIVRVLMVIEGFTYLEVISEILNLF